MDSKKQKSPFRIVAYKLQHYRKGLNIKELLFSLIFYVINIVHNFGFFFWAQITNCLMYLAKWRHCLVKPRPALFSLLLQKLSVFFSLLWVWRDECDFWHFFVLAHTCASLLKVTFFLEPILQYVVSFDNLFTNARGYCHLKTKNTPPRHFSLSGKRSIIFRFVFITRSNAIN